MDSNNMQPLSMKRGSRKNTADSFAIADAAAETTKTRYRLIALLLVYQGQEPS
jgi:hypothetical protein